jgi:hypothetical protein
MFHLIVTQQFGPHAIGDVITDPDEVERLKASSQVVRIAATEVHKPAEPVAQVVVQPVTQAVPVPAPVVPIKPPEPEPVADKPAEPAAG